MPDLYLGLALLTPIAGVLFVLGIADYLIERYRQHQEDKAWERAWAIATEHRLTVTPIILSEAFADFTGSEERHA